MTVFRYLRTLVDENCSSEREIRLRTEQASAIFIAMRKFFITTEVNVQLYLRMVQYYVYPVLLYGCEVWTLNKSMEARIDAFEMYIYRRLLKITWTHKITNVEVLQRIGRDKKVLLTTVKQRKLGYLGYITRGRRYELLKLVVERKIQENSKETITWKTTKFTDE